MSESHCETQKVYYFSSLYSYMWILPMDWELEARQHAVYTMFVKVGRRKIKYFTNAAEQRILQQIEYSLFKKLR